MTEFDLNSPRAMALSVALHAAKLEDRVTFAEAILPWVERVKDQPRMIGFIAAQIPQGLPPQQWLALAEDIAAFLRPGEAA